MASRLYIEQKGVSLWLFVCLTGFYRVNDFGFLGPLEGCCLSLSCVKSEPHGDRVIVVVARLLVARAAGNVGTVGAALVVHVAGGRWALRAYPRLVVEGAALLGRGFGGSGAAGAVTCRHLHVRGYVLT